MRGCRLLPFISSSPAVGDSAPTQLHKKQDGDTVDNTHPARIQRDASHGLEAWRRSDARKGPVQAGELASRLAHTEVRELMDWTFTISGDGVRISFQGVQQFECVLDWDAITALSTRMRVGFLRSIDTGRVPLLFLPSVKEKSYRLRFPMSGAELELDGSRAELFRKQLLDIAAWVHYRD